VVRQATRRTAFASPMMATADWGYVRLRKDDKAPAKGAGS